MIRYPRFIPGPLNLQIKHWAALLKVLLLTDLCFVSLVQCLFSEHLSPACVRRAACAVLYFIKSLLILNVACPYCTKVRDCNWVRSNTPTMREVDWMNGSRHNKNANRQTDRRTEIPAFIREEYEPPPSEASNIRC